VTDPELFSSWIVSYGREKITLSADVSDPITKKIAFRGWQRKSEKNLFDHLEYFNDRGLNYAKSTDVTRDGVLEGPIFNFIRKSGSNSPTYKFWPVEAYAALMTSASFRKWECLL